MNDSVKLLEDDGQDVNLSEIESLLTVLAKRQTELDGLEEKVKLAKEEVNRLETVTIPEKMGALTEVKVRIGPLIAIVKVKKILRANIKKENKAAAYEWLDGRGHGDLIKTEVNISFGRAELERAKEITRQLTDMGLTPSLDQTIHWATLDSFIKEQLEKGMEFPNIISIYEGKKVEVKYGK